MVTKQEIVSFAQKHGYERVVYLGKWRGYDSYEPILKGFGMDDDAVAYIGLPFTILVKGDEIRLSTAEEALQQLDEIEE